MDRRSVRQRLMEEQTTDVVARNPDGTFPKGVSGNPAGTANGSIRVKVTNLSTGSTILDNTLSSIITRGSGDPVSRYHTMQNYLGNESPGGTRMFIDMEDIYISSVSSGSNFSGCYLVEFDDTNTVVTTVGPLA